jgi:hypothetical protein
MTNLEALRNEPCETCEGEKVRRFQPDRTYDPAFWHTEPCTDCQLDGRPTGYAHPELWEWIDGLCEWCSHQHPENSNYCECGCDNNTPMPRLLPLTDNVLDDVGGDGIR